MVICCEPRATAAAVQNVCVGFVLPESTWLDSSSIKLPNIFKPNLQRNAKAFSALVTVLKPSYLMDGCTKEQILQYARSHGLSSNRWVREDIDITSYLPSLHDIESDLADPEDVFKISAPGDAISSEKLALDGPTRTFMQSVCSMQNDESEFDFHACDPSRAMKLKLDEPMLLTDNEADVKSFRKTNERARRLRITCEKAEVDEGKDEGLQWPSGSLKLPAYYTQLAISEKLEIPREALEYLRDTISINHEATDCEDIAEQEIQYRKVKHDFLSLMNFAKYDSESCPRPCNTATVPSSADRRAS